MERRGFLRDNIWQFVAVVVGVIAIFAAYNIFFFSGLKTVTAGRASLIIALNPIVIASSTVGIPLKL